MSEEREEVQERSHVLENAKGEDEPTKQIQIAASEAAEAGDCHVGEPGEGSISREEAVSHCAKWRSPGKMGTKTDCWVWQPEALRCLGKGSYRSKWVQESGEREETLRIQPTPGGVLL